MTTGYSFQSFLATELRRFLTHHRALGKRFDNEENALKLLDRFLCECEVATLNDVTPELLEKFMTSRPRTRPRSYNHLIGVLRRLFCWLVAQGIVSSSPLEVRPRRATQQRTPFLFEPSQIKQLLVYAGNLRDRHPAYFRGPTYRMTFALMYGLGLRVGEVSRLCHEDLDLDRRCLHIRRTKFLKSRLVPFGPRMAGAIEDYLHIRWRNTEHRPDSPLFTLASDGERPICSKVISRAFTQLLPQLALSVPPGVSPPRLHCLRHSFAVSTLLGWYRAGVNPSDKLLYLSAFLGHVNPASTAVYLTITTEILEQANLRFESFSGSVLKELHS